MWATIRTVTRSFQAAKTARSKSGVQVGWHAHHPHHSHPITPFGLVRVAGKNARAPPAPHPDTLQLVEERKGDGSALDASGSGAVAERDGATLRLKEGGGVFYAPGPLQSVAVHWPRLVASSQLGELYHLEVQG